MIQLLAARQHVQHINKPASTATCFWCEQLIDVTVARPTTLTLLRGPASTGSHLQPLAAAAQAEKRKHDTYDAECSKHNC